MIYVLDTNTCIYFLRGDYPQVFDRISERASSELAVSTITVAELYYGVYHSTKVEQNFRILESFLRDLSQLSFDSQAARTFGRVKQALAKKGKSVGPYDLLIASLVLSRGYTLVTHNLEE
ncbi:type II toxin-antitoxin system VapC family toxin, partial [Acidobacteria bacterium AH-259-O06]|nr:type II toxin-antitoxin system VapC family toxin [Acidobacteria bacterium AH-259-O06]